MAKTEEAVSQPVQTGLPTLPADGPVIVLDTETTGLDHRTEKIIEVAAIRLENGEIVDRFQTLVNPEQPIRPSSFKIHNISEAMVAEAPTMEEVLPKLLAFMGDLPFVAHNAVFDYSFLNEASKKIRGERITNLRICTLELYRSVFPEEHSHGLGSLMDRFGFPSHVNHRAMDDAEQLALVYPRLRELYVQKQAWQLAQIQQVPYLFERYLRLQKTASYLHAEMQDLKELFKLYFLEGGKPVFASTGEELTWGYRRNYSYDNDQLSEALKELDLLERVSKVNLKIIDRWLSQNPDTGKLNKEQRTALIETRKAMQQTMVIQVNKPVVEEPEAEESEAVD